MHLINLHVELHVKPLTRYLLTSIFPLWTVRMIHQLLIRDERLEFFKCLS